MSIDTCGVCRETTYSWERAHVCKPRFGVLFKNHWMDDKESIDSIQQEEFDQLEWGRAFARDAAEAAKRYAEGQFQSGDGFDDETILYVKDGEGNITMHIVRAEMVLEVWAHKSESMRRRWNDVEETEEVEVEA